MNFKRVDVIALPAPYTTNCFDYNTVGLEGPSQCLQYCLMFNTSISDYRFLTMFNDDYIIAHNKHIEFKIDTSSYCFKKCSRPSCVMNSFFKHGDVQVIRNTLNTAYKLIQLNPIISIEYQPLFSIEVYFIYVSSLICSCLGLCSLSLEHVVRKLMKLFHIRLLRKRIIRRYQKWLVYGLSGIGCILQLVSASRTYFNYDTVSELYIGSPLTIVPPAISFCFPIDEILDKSQLKLHCFQFKYFYKIQ